MNEGRKDGRKEGKKEGMRTTTTTTTTTTTAHMDIPEHPAGNIQVLSFPLRSSGIHHMVDVLDICNACSQRPVFCHPCIF